MWLPHKLQFGCNPATFSLKLFQGLDGTLIGIHDALPEGHNDDKLQCDLMTLTVITICIWLSHYILHHPVSQNESVPTSLSMSCTKGLQQSTCPTIIFLPFLAICDRLQAIGRAS